MFNVFDMLKPTPILVFILAIILAYKVLFPKSKYLAVPRSGQWPGLRRWWIAKKQPNCMACGRNTNLNVHHIVPVHIDKSKELSIDNLITLCEHEDTRCHLMIGHLGNWSHFNTNVVEDAKTRLLNHDKPS